MHACKVHDCITDVFDKHRHPHFVYTVIQIHDVIQIMVLLDRYDHYHLLIVKLNLYMVDKVRI